MAEYQSKATSLLVKDIHNRVYNLNKNWLGIIVGGTGSGKSYAALRLAEQIDPNFSIDQVVFSAEEFLKLLSSGKLTRGNVVIWDEAGVGIPRREWYSISNKLINYILQTFRYENLAVIFTVPTMAFIDSNSQKLFHCSIETLNINKKYKTCECKVKRMEYQPLTDKTYFKFYRNNHIVLSRTYLKLAHRDLRIAYERKKSSWASDLKESALQDLLQLKRKKEITQNRSKNAEEFAKEILKKPKLERKLSTRYRGKWSLKVPMIKSYFNIGKHKAEAVKTLVRKRHQEEGK